MLLTDYLRSEKDITWDFALQCGIKHGVIRLPETADFDVTSKAHWNDVHKKFTDYGITPVIIEPMPNNLHNHIKLGDAERDCCIEKVIKMFPIMAELNIKKICFNWMAHIGWLRTSSDIRERGGAFVTGFNMGDFEDSGLEITSAELWENYEYFLKAVIPTAEKYGIKLALHPDDPPVSKLGNVERIMISKENIKRAVYETVKSDSIGITMCQANFFIMGEDVEEVIRDFADKIMFIHFRNTTGKTNCFRETFHDNGELDMVKLIKLYKSLKIDVPIRVDHVPTMAGEKIANAGYDALGRLFAIGYLKGILESIK